MKGQVHAKGDVLGIVVDCGRWEGSHGREVAESNFCECALSIFHEVRLHHEANHRSCLPNCGRFSPMNGAVGQVAAEWPRRFATRFARIDSRESFAIETLIFYSASGRLAQITRICDSRESPDSRESCELIRANHATKRSSSDRRFSTWASILGVSIYHVEMYWNGAAVFQSLTQMHSITFILSELNHD